MEEHSYSFANASTPVACDELPPFFVRFPAITDAEGKAGPEALNLYFMQKASALMSDYMALPAPVEGASVPTEDWKYTVIRNDGKYFSVLTEGYLNHSGPYPTAAMQGDTFLLAKDTATLLTLDDLFTAPAKKYRPILFDKMKDLSNGSFDQAALESNFDPNCFYLTNDALVLFYPEGTLGPHAIGIQKYSIPLSELSDILV